MPCSEWQESWTTISAVMRISKIFWWSKKGLESSIFSLQTHSTAFLQYSTVQKMVDGIETVFNNKTDSIRFLSAHWNHHRLLLQHQAEKLCHQREQCALHRDRYFDSPSLPLSHTHTCKTLWVTIVTEWGVQQGNQMHHGMSISESALYAVPMTLRLDCRT